MAQDINLHLRKTPKGLENEEDEQEFKNESKARSHAFWGSYHVDQCVTSLPLVTTAYLTLT